MNKQTPLQWYIEQCENIKYNPLEKNGYTIAKEKITKQALEMEREQIIKSNRDGADMIIDKTPFITGKEYYEQTYGGQDE